MSDITEILCAIELGNPQAAEQLLPPVYAWRAAGIILARYIWEFHTPIRLSEQYRRTPLHNRAFPSGVRGE